MKFREVDKLAIDVKEAIKKRVSTRSFEERSLTEEDKNKLINFYKSLTNPFGIDVRVEYISKNTGVENVKLGTYGTIKGAKDFLAIIVKDEPFAMEAVGYQIENLILYATIWVWVQYGLQLHLAGKTLKMLWKYKVMIYFHAFRQLAILLKSVQL